METISCMGAAKQLHSPTEAQSRGHPSHLSFEDFSTIRNHTLPSILNKAEWLSVKHSTIDARIHGDIWEIPSLELNPNALLQRTRAAHRAK